MHLKWQKDDSSAKNSKGIARERAIGDTDP
jgi:hypothetical protein